MKIFNRLSKKQEKIITVISYFLILLFMGYYVLWHKASDYIKEIIVKDFALSGKDSQMEAQFKNVKFSGFPFSLNAQIENFSLKNIPINGSSYYIDPADISINCDIFVKNCTLELPARLIFKEETSHNAYIVDIVDPVMSVSFRKRLLIMHLLTQKIEANHIIQDAEVKSPLIELHNGAGDDNSVILQIKNMTMLASRDPYMRTEQDAINFYYNFGISSADQNKLPFHNLSAVVDLRFYSEKSSSRVMVRNIDLAIDDASFTLSGILDITPNDILPKFTAKISGVNKMISLAAKTLTNNNPKALRELVTRISGSSGGEVSFDISYDSKQNNQIYIGKIKFPDFMMGLIKISREEANE